MQFHFATSCQQTGPRGETAVHAILQIFDCVLWSMFGQDNLSFEGYSVIFPRVHLASLQQDEVWCLVFIILEYTLGSRMRVCNKFFNYLDCRETGLIQLYLMKITTFEWGMSIWQSNTIRGLKLVKKIEITAPECFQLKLCLKKWIWYSHHVINNRRYLYLFIFGLVPTVLPFQCLWTSLWEA